MLLLFQTLEFWILAFPDIGIQFFAFRKHSNSRILPFQTLLSISVFCLIQTSQFWILAFSTLEFTVLAVPNIGLIVDFVGFFQTLEFYILAFPNIAIQCFWLYKKLEFSAFTFANIGILNFAFSIQCDSVFYISSKHWTFRFWSVFPDIRIQRFSFSKHYMEFWILAFKKNWNSVFCILQTLEFKNFTFRKIALQCFRLSKHWNSGFWLFQH